MSESLPETIVCPSCHAKLHNVSVTARKITCLNCGTQFPSPNAAHEPLPEVPANTAATEAPGLGREPRAAGYWMLRIAAMIYGTFALLIFGVSAFSFLAFVFFSGGRGRMRLASGELRLLAWSCLLPLSGWLGVLLTRALARIEAASLRAGWRRSLITRALPPDPSSSLPYLAPFMVAGGLILVFASTALIGSFSGDNRADVIGEIAAIIAGPLVCIVVSFQLIDLRQFIFRQGQLALVFAKDEAPSSVRTWLLGCAAAMLPLGLALLPIKEYFDHPSRYAKWEDCWGGVYLLLFLCGCAWTCFLLGRGIAVATARWAHAAGGERTPLASDPLDLGAVIVAGLAVATGVGAFVIGFFDTRNFGLPDFAQGFVLVVLQVAFVLSLCLLCLEFRQWRRAQQTFWAQKAPKFDPAMSLSAIVPWALALFLMLALIGEGTLQTLTSSRKATARDYVYLTNFVILGVYSGLACFHIARELLMTEAVARLAKWQIAPEDYEE